MPIIIMIKNDEEGLSSDCSFLCIFESFSDYYLIERIPL